MARIIRLTENDLMRIVKRVIKEGSSKCYGEAFESDLCSEFYDEQSSTIALYIAEACGCLSNNIIISNLQNWDEKSFETTVLSIKDRGTYQRVNKILHCFMKANGWKQVDPDPLKYLTIQIFNFHNEQESKNKVFDHLQKLR